MQLSKIITKSDIQTDERIADAAIQDRLMASTSAERFKWVQYCQVDGTFSYFSWLTRPILQRVKGFAARVRSGFYGHSRQIKTASVQVALSAIGTTLVVEGYTFRNPLHGGDGKLVLPLKYLLDAYKQQDPPVLPQLVVPLELILAARDLLPAKGLQ